jgi:hypothetical protein
MYVPFSSCRPQFILNLKYEAVLRLSTRQKEEFSLHFGGAGPNLRRLFLMLHTDGQITTQRMTTLLNDVGVEIRKRHVGRCLTERLDGFHAEDAAVL